MYKLSKSIFIRGGLKKAKNTVKSKHFTEHVLLYVGYMRSLNNTFKFSNLFLAFQRNLDAVWLTGPYINSSKEILIENLTGSLDSFGILKALRVVCALETLA